MLSTFLTELHLDTCKITTNFCSDTLKRSWIYLCIQQQLVGTYCIQVIYCVLYVGILWHIPTSGMVYDNNNTHSLQLAFLGPQLLLEIFQLLHHIWFLKLLELYMIVWWKQISYCHLGDKFCTGLMCRIYFCKHSAY